MVPQVSIARTRPSIRSSLALVLVCLVLAIGPFIAALGVHHELAAADHDGHQHSDFDLCQWVQLHSTGSLFAAVVEPERLTPPERQEPLPPTTLSSGTFISTGPSRAPPLS